jgi:XTP/dITP diphosphohydrolase
MPDAVAIKVVYATSSRYKREEVEFLRHLVLDDGEEVGDRVEWQLRDIALKETLEVDLCDMVAAEAREAYRAVLVPCIVEHAGLIFERYRDEGYPGGLTKPMWNTLADRFVVETQMEGERATARAVIGYCDGKSVRTFVGETHGHLVAEPRGDRGFYWDTVFVPDEAGGAEGDRTYAEIAGDPDLGLRHKVTQLSQSGKAMRDFLAFRLVSPPPLWAAF